MAGDNLYDDSEPYRDDEDPNEQVVNGYRMGFPAPAAAMPNPDAPPNVQTPMASMPDAVMKTGLPPAPPSSADTIGPLLKQQAEYGKPLDRTDPKYKMGLGAKILGTLANAATGFASRGTATPIYVGSGATNRRYDTDEAAREQNLASVGTEIAGQEKLSDENTRAYQAATQGALRQGQIEQYEARAADYQKRAEDFGSKPVSGTETQDDQGQWWAKNARGEDIKLPGEPKAVTIANTRAQTAANKEPTNEIELSLALQKARLKGDKDKTALYTGALQELAKQKAAMREPKDASASDVAKAIQVAEHRSREQDRIDSAQTREQEKRYADLEKDLTLKYDPQKMAAAKAAINSELQGKYDQQRQRIDSDSDQMLGLTKAGPKLQRGNNPPVAPAAKPAAQPSAPTVKPAKPTAPAPAGRVYVYERATGKIGSIPQSQVSTATSGANAKYATF